MTEGRVSRRRNPTIILHNSQCSTSDYATLIRPTLFPLVHDVQLLLRHGQARLCRAGYRCQSWPRFTM